MRLNKKQINRKDTKKNRKVRKALIQFGFANFAFYIDNLRKKSLRPLRLNKKQINRKGTKKNRKALI
ncbi:hypothetical protein [Flavobacterium sp.]|uniref:hypothetical protein n=1 Tax=Flavobacterium sp. TaxID=239 RepID=UPI002EDA535D